MLGSRLNKLTRVRVVAFPVISHAQISKAIAVIWLPTAETN
jgi:hypothetical protein